MRAYFLKDDGSEGKAVSTDELKSLNVLHWDIDMSADYIKEVDRISTERKYTNRDEIKLTSSTEGLEAKLEMFFKEHHHEDEEIRFFMDGAGYFDVRSAGDEWIRIACSRGDLLIVPPSLHHRFALDDTKFVHAMRLFQDEPKWTPIYREV